MDNIITSLIGDNATTKTLASLWFLTAFGVIARKLPATIIDALDKLFTTKIYSVDDGYCSRKEFFNMIEIFISKYGKTDRYETVSFAIVNGVKKPMPGPGRGWFFHRGVLIVFRKTVETGVASNWQGNTQHVTLRLFTRSDKKIQGILSDIHLDQSKRMFKQMVNGNWEDIATIQQTAKIFLNPQVKDKIDREVLFFKDNRQWYLDRGLPWKLTILLHGKPGTGKTTITRYISDLLGGDIYQASLKTLAAGDSMVGTVMKVESLSVLSIEDFDDTPGISERIPEEEDKKQVSQSVSPQSKREEVKRSTTVNGVLSQFLNTFQGLVPLHGQVTVLTTNHPDRIDKAALREGRIDLSLEIGPMLEDQIREFISYNYSTDYQGKLTPQVAAKVFNSFSRNPKNLEGFIDAINTPTKL